MFLAGLDLADVPDDADLHRDDFQLLAGSLTDRLLAAAAVTGQSMLVQLMNDFDTG